MLLRILSIYTALDSVFDDAFLYSLSQLVVIRGVKITLMAKGAQAKAQYSAELVQLEFNFKGSLQKKVDKLLPEKEWKEMGKTTAKNESIQQVVNDVRLRITKTTNKKTPKSRLDRRMRSPSHYVNKGFLKDGKSVAEDNLKIPREDLPRVYHEEQKVFFERAANRFPDLFHCIEQYEANSGLWNLRNKREQKTLSTTQFVNFVDKITERLIGELRKGKTELDKLQLLYDSCEKVVMARHLLDILLETDIMDAKETERWRNHFEVLISFSAVLVILKVATIKPAKLERNNNYLPYCLPFFLLPVFLLLLYFLLLAFFSMLDRYDPTLRNVYLVFLLILWGLTEIISRLARS